VSGRLAVLEPSGCVGSHSLDERVLLNPRRPRAPFFLVHNVKDPDYGSRVLFL